MRGRGQLEHVVLPVLLVLLLVAPPGFAGEDDCPGLNGEAAALIDAQSGRLLWGHGEDELLPPASTTKVLTGIIALEQTHPQEEIKISENAEAQRGSQVYLTAGERYTAEELVEALLLASANDAAVALAEHISGSEEEFARLMNRRAREMGAENSHFCNPHGLPDDEHVTTAKDLALITSEALENSRFAEIVATRESTMSWPGRDEDRVLRNRNRLLWMNESEGIDGVKTGYTSAAGNCLIGSATRDGRRVVAAVLGGDPDTYWDDVRGLLDYGFENYENHRVVEPNAVVAEIKPRLAAAELAIETGGALDYPLAPGEEERLERELHLDENLEAPVGNGEPAGRMVVSLEGEELGEVGLLAAHRVDKVWYAEPELQAAGGGLALGLALLGFAGLIRRRRAAGRRGI